MQMNGVIIDTSAWIEFFNKSDSEISNTVRNIVSDNTTIYLCPIIWQEILQGIKLDKDFKEIKYIFSFYPILKTDPMEIAEKAVDIYRTTRKNGITIRKSNDCSIAAYAILNNLVLLQYDRDFKQMQKVIKELKLL